MIWYTLCCKLVAYIVNGNNGTVFAYGQTGTVFTKYALTLLYDLQMRGVRNVPELRGIIPIGDRRTLEARAMVLAVGRLS